MKVSQIIIKLSIAEMYELVRVKVENKWIMLLLLNMKSETSLKSNNSSNNNSSIKTELGQKNPRKTKLYELHRIPNPPPPTESQRISISRECD